MAASEAAGIVEPPFGVVGTDVVTVPLPKLLDRILNGPENRWGIFTLEREQEGSNSTWMDFGTHVNPPSSLISLVLKFVWQPAPFQFPGIGLGSNEATTPKSSQTRCRRKRATHRWSPMLIPSHGPTWNSH